MTRKTAPLSVSWEGDRTNVRYSPSDPPEVYFDKNVLVSMSPADVNALGGLRTKHGFRYRFTFTNFIELACRLADDPDGRIQDPFTFNRKGFRNIVELCEPEILPSAEFEIMSAAALEALVHPAWRLDVEQFALTAELIANANCVDEIRAIPLAHYRNLAEVDRTSMQQIYAKLRRNPPKLDPRDPALLGWLLRTCGFLILIRATGSRVPAQALSQRARDRFVEQLGPDGYGALFTSHWMSRVRRILGQQARPDPRDIYDALQLIHLGHPNRVFVTDDKAYSQYFLNEPTIQRVLSWRAFRRSA